MRFPTILTAAFLAGCALTSVAPEEAGPRIVTALDEGKVSEAASVFGDTAERERLYPVLYQAAETRFEEGRYAQASEVLRFMKERYPDARSVREALLYSLFLERAEGGGLEEEELEEMAALASELENAPGAEPWVRLASVQVAVDRGRPEEAREALTGFVDSWDGQPASLLPYVEDLERWIQSH